MKIEASYRLKASKDYDQVIETMKELLAFDGKLVVKSDSVLKFELDTYPNPTYISMLEKRLGTPRIGHSSTETIYTWHLKDGLGIRLFRPTDENAKAHLDVYYR